MMASPFWWDRSTGHPVAIGSRRRESCFAWPVCIVILLTVFPFGIAQSQVIDTPSVGISKLVEQIVLPGSELTHRQVDPKTSPLIVRVVRSFPHGDAFRYDISYFGMDAGEFDLKDYLVRQDGSTTADLPSIAVKVDSILVGGQVEPNPLQSEFLTRVGGYWQMVWVGVALWCVILLILIFGWQRKRVLPVAEVSREMTLSERLRPLVASAIEGRLPAEKHAELERMLVVFWEKRLGIDANDPAGALHEIRRHEVSGPHLRQIEMWLHSPAGASVGVDVSKLLEPYQTIDSDELHEAGIGGPTPQFTEEKVTEEKVTEEKVEGEKVEGEKVDGEKAV